MTGDAASDRDAGAADGPRPPVTTRTAAEPSVAAEEGTKPAPPFFSASRGDEPELPRLGDDSPEMTPDAASRVDADAPSAADPAEWPGPSLELAESASAPAEAAQAGAAPGPGAGTERIADRLEALADRLRSEGRAALDSGYTHGDRLDALLSGVLIGYLSGRGDG